MMRLGMAGGCACGRIRYTINGAPSLSLHCQCRKCQRATGTGHASIIVVPVYAIDVAGVLSEYSQPSDSGHDTTACFCPTCGSPILNKAARFPDSRYVHVGSLDDPSQFKPALVAFRDAAQPWDHIDPDLS
jgi:hypothetical protein